MSALALVLALSIAGGVQSGLDVLVADHFAPLAGKRVGLVTNHAAIAKDRRSAVDLLRAADGVRLVALFSPEHGLRGTADAEVGSEVDQRTGLPVHSLYGEHKKPPPELLTGIDVLVIDLQDIGARFYTYGTTMAYCMQAAAAAGKEVIVLDRPNPIGGVIVEGPTLDPDLRGGFISFFPLATRHGMTLGELALLYNRELAIGARLTVIAMKGWRRAMRFDETGLPWVDPSPSMKSLRAATSYPGLGVLEGTNLSVGRGTPTPFEIYGAPWLDAEAVVADLTRRRLPGVRFEVASFTPRPIAGRPRYPFTDEACRGFAVVITDAVRYRPVTAVVHVLDALHRRHARELRFGTAAAMIGRKAIEARLTRGDPVGQIVASWRADLEGFRALRGRYLLYR